MSKTPETTGSVELLTEQHLDQQNQWNKPVVGWLPTSQGLGGLFNPMGFALLRVVVNKVAGDIKAALYDQPMIVENAGVIIIAQMGDKVALVRNFRMIGPRLLPDAGASYIKKLNETKSWSKLLDSLGRWSIECPRGLAPGNGEEDMEAFLIRTAKLEVLEEAGLTIKNAKVVGNLNANTTFFAHAQMVVLAEIISIGEANPEDLEIIGGVDLYTMAELRELNDSGEFTDGLTLAALALCGMHI